MFQTDINSTDSANRVWYGSTSHKCSTLWEFMQGIYHALSDWLCISVPHKAAHPRMKSNELDPRGAKTMLVVGRSL